MRFSIGIPAFKARFLYDCIASVLGQTYADFELIIVNDASPENVEGVVNNFSDKRIRYYVNEKNYGAENVVDNWNKCLSYARGDFFILMGDDDVMAPNYLEEFNCLIQKFNSLDVFHCRSKIINEKSEPFFITQGLPPTESVYESIWHRINGWRMQYISDFVYRTRALKANGGFFKIKLAWASDDISSFIAMGHKGIANINIPLLYYRRTNLTISMSGSTILKLEAIKEERRWYENFLKTEDPQDEHDRHIKSWIENALPLYFKKKTINTIAYFGYHRSFIFLDLIRWLSLRKKYNLNTKEVFYTCILGIKKRLMMRNMLL